MRTGKCWRLIPVLIGLLTLAQGQGLAATNEGTTGADFLNLIPGARAEGMSGAYTAVGNDGESLFANPAGILELVNPQIYVSHLAWWEDVGYDSFWGVQPLGELGTAGWMASYLHLPSFNSTEDPSLSESAWNLAIGGGFARAFGRHFSAGAAVRYLGAQLGGKNSWGVTVDAGVKYFMQNDRLILAADIRNAGFQTAFETTSDALPLTACLGLGWQFWNDESIQAKADAEVSLPEGGRPAGAFGIESWFWNYLALRAGVNNRSDMGDWLSLGAGVHWQQFHVDYALKPVGLLGMVHHLSAGYDFGSQLQLAKPVLKLRLVNRQVVSAGGEIGYQVDFIPDLKIPAGLASWRIEISNRAGQKIRKLEGADTLPLRITWNGCDEQEHPMDLEGYYVYVMTVEDRRGYTDEARGEILPVSITQLPKLKALPRDIFAGRVTFMPKGSENVREWSISIVSNDGTVLKKYQGVGAFPKDFSWDGKDDRQRQVSVQEGFHYILQTKDEGGNEVKSVAPLAQIEAGTKAYTPQEVKIPEQVVFHFRLIPEIKFKGWALDIIDAESGKVVRTYNAEGHPPESVTWDGRDDQAQLLPLNRKFNYVLRLQDQIGNVWQQQSSLGTTEVKILSATPRETRIKLEQILFEFNKAELLPAMFDKLHKVADLAKQYSPQNVKILIEGHTDEIGSDQFNQELSLNRAKMVMRYLVEEENLPSVTIEVQGYGKTVPLFTGNDPESRAKNRRVEITLDLTP